MSSFCCHAFSPPFVDIAGPRRAGSSTLGSKDTMQDSSAGPREKLRVGAKKKMERPRGGWA